MLFSIITVTYNAASVLPPTLESIRCQSCDDYEFVAQDGASSDGTVELLRTAGLRATRLESRRDKGLYDAMNRAIDRARGEYLIFLNAGDSFASENTLQRLAECAKSNPDVIYGQTRLVDRARRIIGPRHLTAPLTLDAESFLRGMVVCHQAFVARRELCPHYDNERYRFSADYDWCIKILKQSKQNAYAGNEPLVNFLIDESGTTERHHRASLKERYTIMCRHYGTARAIASHLTFIPRALARKARAMFKRHQSP